MIILGMPLSIIAQFRLSIEAAKGLKASSGHLLTYKLLLYRHRYNVASKTHG